MLPENDWLKDKEGLVVGIANAQSIDYYVFRARREIGALSAVLGGLYGLVFCGGIGENATEIRQRIVAGLDYLGLRIDDSAQPDAREIGRGAVRILVIPTDEEHVIARAVHDALGRGAAGVAISGTPTPD